MKKINLAITGCLGRMGQQLIKSSKQSRDFKVVSITERKKINKKISGLKPSLNSKDAFQNGSDWLVIGRPITKGNIKKNLKKLINHLDK